MTTARNEWIRAQERKRDIVSFSASLCVYAIAFGIAALISVFTIVDVSEFSGPIIVRLGSPLGVDAIKPTALTEAIRQSAAVQVEAPAQPEPIPAAPETEASVSVPAVPAPTPARPTPTTKPSLSPATAPTAKLAPSVAASSSSSSAAVASVTPAPVVLRGSESGNSYDMTFQASAGKVGRSLYEPIWLYMPLPFELPTVIHDGITDLAGIPGTAATRRSTFESFYEKKANGLWQLKWLRQPDFNARPELWAMLEEAGYDIKNADYKEGKRLRSVEILFKVSAPGSSGTPKLEDVQLESGSGDSDIDAAVLFGFRRAEFSNSSANSISGRFTYRF